MSISRVLSPWLFGVSLIAALAGCGGVAEAELEPEPSAPGAPPADCLSGTPCANGEFCGVDGRCTPSCTPDCSSGVAGPDGCGGLCEAAPEVSDDAGEPVVPVESDGGAEALDGCVPLCLGRSCGDDGCGGSCGPACSTGQLCQADGQCGSAYAPSPVTVVTPTTISTTTVVTQVISAQNSDAGVSVPHLIFGAPLRLPVTAAGQRFALRASATLAQCTSVGACEVAIELKCWQGTPRASTRVGDQEWAAENLPATVASRPLVARMIYTSVSAAPVNCQPEFYYSDHGTHISGDSLKVLAGATFSAVGPLSNTAVTQATGGAVRLWAGARTADVKAIGGWTTTGTGVSFVGDLQVTECHVPYPRGADLATSPYHDASKYCTVAETAGTDTNVKATAYAVELGANMADCHVTAGTLSTGGPPPAVSVSTVQHHKMLYTAVLAKHFPGCANRWRFFVRVQWVSGRSFAINSAPLGQGQVRPQ